MQTHEQVRIALGRGFSVDNLRSVTNLCLNALQSENPKNPIVFHTTAVVCRWIADAWDGIPLPTPVANRVERTIKPKLETLLDNAEANPPQLCRILNEVATAFTDAIAQGLDS